MSDDREYGPLESAVRLDLKELNIPPSGIHRTLTEMAYYLARTIDDRGTTEGPSACARVVTELTKIMNELMSRSSDDDSQPRPDLSQPM